MRFSIIFIALALLPMMMIAHGWIFTEQQLPHLREQALEALQENGIHSAVVDLRYLDLRIAGSGPDLQSLARARAAVMAIGPVRLIADELIIPASLRARLEGDKLTLEGWLPSESGLQNVTQLLAKLRPDLSLDMAALKTDPQVQWPEGEKEPLTKESRLLAPIVEKLRVTPWIEMVRDAQGLHVKGILPANGLRAALIATLSPVDAEELLESTHTQEVSFANEEAMIPFVQSFFKSSLPREFDIHESGEPTLIGVATLSQETEWLALLRPVTGGKKVTLKLTLYPSEWHFPRRPWESPLPEPTLRSLAETLDGLLIQFSASSTTLSSEEQARLAALTPALLTAGPALRLIIGGHPDPAGDSASEKQLAKARAEQVLSFLIEQGLPTSDVEVVAFDPVPTGTPGAPSSIHSVEIMLR